MENYGLSPEYTIFKLNGKELDLNMTLKECGVKEGDTIVWAYIDAPTEKHKKSLKVMKIFLSS